MEGATDPSRNAKESLELAHQISQLLGTGFDRYTLSLLIALCDRGANPEALAALVQELSARDGSAFSSTNGSASSATVIGASSFRSNFKQF